jgi:glycosyltransferase involved in cell wall biosynthesis
MVRVSVVIAFHRIDEYLRLAVESILLSTEKDVELLLIADRLTAKDIEALMNKLLDPRVRVLSSPGEGAGDARNEGFRVARGKYIAILDSDDVAYAERLKAQADYLDRHDDVVAVGSQLEKINALGEVIGVSNYPKRVKRSFFHKPFDGMIANPSSMIRKNSLEKVGGGYRKQFSKTVEDLDLWNRLLRVGRIVILPQVLIGYRSHELQNTATNAGEISWHLEIVQLIDIHEAYGNGEYSLESLGELSPSAVVTLKSKKARSTLGIRGKIRFAVFDQLNKADEVRRLSKDYFGDSEPIGPFKALIREVRVFANGPLLYIVKTLHHSRFLSY